MVHVDSDIGRRTLGLRPLVAIGVLAALELLAVRALRSGWRVVDRPGPASLDEAVLLVVLAACTLLGGWLLVGTTTACAAHLPGRLGSIARRWSRAVAPAATRRFAAMLVGAALTGSLAPGTASGTTGGHPGPERAPGFALTLPSPGPVPTTPPAPGWTPSRPVHPAAPAAGLVTTGRSPRTSEVVVHRGDTLWSIVRRHLGPGASDAEVAAAWPHWYATNRDLIGPDPDLLLPGQVLRPPDPSRPARDVGAHP